MCHESVTMCACYTRSMWMCTFGEYVCKRWMERRSALELDQGAFCRKASSPQSLSMDVDDQLQCLRRDKTDHGLWLMMTVVFSNQPAVRKSSDPGKQQGNGTVVCRTRASKLKVPFCLHVKIEKDPRRMNTFFIVNGFQLSSFSSHFVHPTN